MTDSKDLLLDGASGAAPDYMQGVGDDEFGGGMDGSAYPRLAFKLARFRLRQGEEEIVLPDNTIEVIILRDYPAISRIFFDSSFDSSGDEDNRPACASADGEHPLSTIAAPQNAQCATCPQNQKGSRITDDGSKARACGFYKRLIVLIKGFEDVGPIVTDVKSMSIFGDSRSGDNQWTLKAYFARLKANGVAPFHLWTEMSFDTDESVPKVLFRPMAYVEKPVFIDTVTPLIATPDGKQLLLEMVDTGKVRIEGEDDDDKMALPPGEKPAHLEAPKEEKPEPTLAERVATLGEQLNHAIETKDFVGAQTIQAEIEALTAEDKPDPAEEQREPELTPAQKAAKTRAANKAKKEAANKAAEAKPEPSKANGATPTAEVETGASESGFDDELDSALKDFGF